MALRLNYICEVYALPIKSYILYIRALKVVQQIHILL